MDLLRTLSGPGPGSKDGSNPTAMDNTLAALRALSRIKQSSGGGGGGVNGLSSGSLKKEMAVERRMTAVPPIPPRTPGKDRAPKTPRKGTTPGRKR